MMDNKERIEQIIKIRNNDIEEQLRLCQEILDNNPNDYETASALLYKADAYLDYVRPEDAIKCGLEALNIASSFGYQDIIMMIHNILGITFSLAGDVNSSIEHYIQALNEAQKYNNFVLVAAVYSNLTVLFMDNEDYDSALEFCNKYWFYIQKISYNEENVNVEEINYYIYHAEISFLRKDYEEAEKYLYYSINMSTQNGLPDEIQNVLAARLALVKNKRNEAYEYLKKIKSIEHIHIIDKFAILKSVFEVYMIMDDEKSGWETLNRLKEVVQTIDCNKYWVEYWQQCIIFCKKYDKSEILKEAYREFYVRCEALEDITGKLRIQWLKNKIQIFDIKKENKELLDEKNKLEKAALKDELTGLWKRNGYYTIVQEMYEKCYSEGWNFTAAVIDIDYFKEYNDTYGHQMGDKCIKAIAEILKEQEGEQGCCVRFGGDEFMLFWRNISEKLVRDKIESIISNLKKRNIEHIGSKVAGQVTVSIGATTGIPKNMLEFSEYIHCADEALYDVKRNGKASYVINEFSSRG